MSLRGKWSSCLVLSSKLAALAAKVALEVKMTYNWELGYSKETHFSNLGQRQSCFSSFKQFVHSVDAQNCVLLALCLLLCRLVNKTIGYILSKCTWWFFSCVKESISCPLGWFQVFLIKLHGHFVPALHTMSDLVQITPLSLQKKSRGFLLLSTMNKTFSNTFITFDVQTFTYQCIKYGNVVEVP